MEGTHVSICFWTKQGEARQCINENTPLLFPASKRSHCWFLMCYKCVSNVFCFIITVQLTALNQIPVVAPHCEKKTIHIHSYSTRTYRLHLCIFHWDNFIYKNAYVCVCVCTYGFFIAHIVCCGQSQLRLLGDIHTVVLQPRYDSLIIKSDHFPFYCDNSKWILND